ncbi:MAG: hypothetical protein LN414_02125 [Candidatus Thermoplasmatota archaeon]|nr:hypothetical protein [Candidatus Thermoplasmatota archaeon]
MPLMVPPEDEKEELDAEPAEPLDPEDISKVVDEDSGLDIMVPGVDKGVEGVDASVRERAEAGLQDTLDLRDWKMPSIRDYFWYLFVYTILIALAVQVIYRYRMLWAYVLWGSYLATMLVLAALILRSMNYRRGTYSKGFVMSTLELQQAIEDAVEDVRLKIDRMEQPEGVFLRPMIAVYHLKGRGFTINLEGRAHLKRKVIRVGRFPQHDDLFYGQELISALDCQADEMCRKRQTRSLFREEGTY